MSIGILNKCYDDNGPEIEKQQFKNSKFKTILSQKIHMGLTRLRDLQIHS